jgi:hypothetical protein
MPLTNPAQAKKAEFHIAVVKSSYAMTAASANRRKSVKSNKAFIGGEALWLYDLENQSSWHQASE